MLNVKNCSFPPQYHPVSYTVPLVSGTTISLNDYRESSVPKPMFLVHAVMALAGHHLESTSTDTHRHAALQSLRQNLDKYNSTKHRESILDTIIILFSLDETQSALGTWRTHLLGAYGLFEACGGIEKWATSARTQVQIGILLWWDAITSLVNREDCVLPYAYFEALMSGYNGQEWDFFRLCGCPLSLVKVVMQLARLAAEQRRSSLNQYTTFDTTLLSALEKSLESWHHISPVTAFHNEESMQQDVDNMHCAEAWRNGLLLYLYRVFRWMPGCSVPFHILYRARTIMDHVFACRDKCMISRQALLPLFFAGCELQAPSSHRKILNLCASWNDRTRYHMFSTTMPLLEAVWAEQKTNGFENVWWGQIIDRQHSSDSHSPLQVRICFG
ncbi:fungal-specific transcription factor domain-containing protein [Aspergillus caelatus]|uniref:Fungal-specific transcription factor domain-containing protein n=1 Tax=Aspergillus caelatus TaxID=61420 RepID=A0A5N7ADH8_9EURO|nr:fungal-specific transcription factor domain-containing protein [Aspergillus caelatus]KAE8367924.1 fungal-specific transcription factor domain-containing protein [Aspergillus caelatus]